MGGSPLDKDDAEEVKRERAYGRVLLDLVKHPAVFWPLLGGAIASGWVRETSQAPEEQYWEKAEIRQIMRSEIAPLRAGIEELAKAQSPRIQVSVLQAMLKAERRNAEAQP